MVDQNSTIDLDDNLRRLARVPHELLMINLGLFHLLLAPAVVMLGVGVWGLLATPTLSGVVMGYMWVRTGQAEANGSWFVSAHWHLALRRCRLLLMAYGASALIIGGGALAAAAAGSESMGDIILTIATRIGVMPTVIAVLIVLVLSNGGLDLANRGEVPEAMRRRYPPPAV